MSRSKAASGACWRRGGLLIPYRGPAPNAQAGGGMRRAKPHCIFRIATRPPSPNISKLCLDPARSQAMTSTRKMSWTFPTQQSGTPSNWMNRFSDNHGRKCGTSYTSGRRVGILRKQRRQADRTAYACPLFRLRG